MTGLASPVAIAFRKSSNAVGAMYVAEQGGTLRRIVNGQAGGNRARPARQSESRQRAGISRCRVSADGTRLYVDYTDANGDTNVDEYTMQGVNADANSRRRVLFVEQPYENHNGGEVVFGPDGELYVGLGDGGSAGDPQNHGQDLGTMLGKILRIDPKRKGTAAYSIPADNPFVGRAGDFAENWMYGLRNPWRFSFDRANGDLWIGDVGQGVYEEVDYRRARRRRP